MQYDLNLLRAFVTLVEERSVTRAADRLGLSQPAMSAALSRLRVLLRDPLFVRQRYGMIPTERALDLAPAMAAALAGLDALVLGLQDFDPATADGQVTIAVNGYAEFVLLPALVAVLRTKAPGLRLRVLPFGVDLAETGVMSGDTALVLGRVVDPPDNLVVQEITRDGFACVLRAGHPRIADGLDRDTFESLKHVNVLPPGRLRAGLFQAFERAGLRREVAVSVTHFLSIPDLIAETDYCSTLPQAICHRLAGDPRLSVVAPPADLGTFPVHLAWHVRHRQDPAHRWLRDLIAGIAATLPRHAVTAPGSG